MENLFLKIGLGGLINGELLTFDFTEGERLKPYVCKILGRDFQYGMKREFIERRYDNFKKIFYSDKKMTAISFKLDRYMVYEYKRFPGQTLGEVVEGYFVILKDCVKELEYEEVFHWCGTAREKERSSLRTREIFNPGKNYAPDDIDF